MSYLTLQKDLERITLKKDLDQALEKMVNFEEEVNRNEEEEEDIDDSDDSNSEEEEEEEEENVYNFAQLTKSYLFGFVLGYSATKISMYINGRTKNNQR